MNPGMTGTSDAAGEAAALEATPAAPVAVDVRIRAPELARVVELAAEAQRVTVVPESVLTTASRYVADCEPDTLGALRALAATCLEHGLSPVVHRVGFEELGALLQDGLVLALWCDQFTEGRWILVQGRADAHHVIVHDLKSSRRTKKKVRLQRFLEGLQAGGMMSVSAVSIEPRYPLDVLGGNAVGGDPGPDRALRRLWSFVRLEGAELWMVVVYAVLIGVLSLITPVAVQALVNTIAFGSVLQPLIILTLALTAGLTFAAGLEVLRMYVVEILQRRVFVRVAGDFGRRLSRLHADFHDGRNAPELANRFFDVITVQKAGSTLAIDALGLLLQTAIGMILLAFYHPLLLAFDGVLVILLAALIILPAKKGAKSAIYESKAKFATAAWLETVAANPMLFANAESVDSAAARTEALCRTYLDKRATHYKKLLTQIVGGLGLQVFASVALLGVGGWLVINRQLTLGQLVAAELVVNAIGNGFSKLGKQIEKLYDAVAAMDKIGEVVDAKRERDGGEPVRGTGPLHLRLKQVAHPRLASTIDADIRAGERIGIVGGPGSGKTTLLDIIAGRRDPSAGALRADGVDLRQADLLRYRQDVGMLNTDVRFAATTIGEYMRFAEPFSTGEQIREALQAVGLGERVLGLPDGLESKLLPDGGPLSRTEALRLSVARILVQQPRLVLIDLTLDVLSEHSDIADILLRRGAPWTVVIVSRHEEILSRCDRVITLNPAEPDA
ncbi:MAG: ATP-binding cassette domain-containing protein [Myxococcota bacterium]